MYGNDYLILAGLLSLVLIVTFFVMANRLGKIKDILEFFQEIELRKPENWTTMKCEKCGKDIRISKAMKGTVNCPECKTINKIVNN